MKTEGYLINKGVNRPVEFRGLKGQWIWRMGGAMVGLLLVFAILYLSGVNPWLCIGVIGVAGTIVFVCICRLSRQYGEHGWMKRVAARQLPRRVISETRSIFSPCKND